ncbi:augurin-B [Triplophysa rosa]|uniref:augurin-B n=1 Tax=Triplophysa rosa TaxID=992332 RepID=UPI002545C6F5|nr:augurin-B [Triplophysa rosa]
MSLPSLCVQAVLLISILCFCAPASGGSSKHRLHRIIRKQDVKELKTRTTEQIAVSQSKAKEFLSVLHRSKRNVWDRSRPDVQQWIQQFMYMGYDEARLETDLSYWMDRARSQDQRRQHHHDENAPMSQQDPSSYRHGANVNYDY